MAAFLLGVLGSIVLINGLMFLQLPAMVFHPSPTLESNPEDWGMVFEDVWLEASDGVELHGWYLPREGASRVLLFFHGNAGNMSHRRASVEIFQRLGLKVFIFDYRGYGRSGGWPSERGFYRDAAAAWSYLTRVRHFAPQDIVVFGRSLGGAVAAHLASGVEPGGLILESTLSSTRDFAHRIHPFLSRAVVLRYDFDTVASLSQVRCPVLVLHSPGDDIMPFTLGEKVFRAASEPKRFVELQGDHNGGFIRSQPHYEQALSEFLGSLAGRQ